MDHKEFQKIIDKAVEEKASIQISSYGENELLMEFKEYEKIVSERGESEGLCYLIRKMADRQIRKASSSSRITSEKRERVIDYWTLYLYA